MAGTDLEPKPGSSKKKWIIGCGGCLGVVLILAVIAGVVANMGFNAMMQASNESVQKIFGASYKTPPGVQAIGFPIEKLSAESEIKNMVLLMNQDDGEVMFAFDKNMNATEKKLLKDPDPKKVDDYLKSMGQMIISNSEQGSSSNKVRDIRFEGTEMKKAGNGKSFPMTIAVAQLERRGQIIYTPGVAAIIPEANDHLTVLFGMGGKDHASTDEKADFKAGQEALMAKIVNLINVSELDDRLQTSTGGK